MKVPVIDLSVFVGLTLLIITSDYPGIVNTHNCTITVNKDEIFANCSYRDMLVDVPQDLHSDTTHIDISGNIWHNLAGLGKDFSKYIHLKTLIMRDMVKKFDVPFSKAPYMFKNTYSLETIDFSRSFVEDSAITFVWPPNIRIIYFADNPYIRSLEVDNLKKLEKLYASGLSAMTKFPKFHELASVTVIDIKGSQVEDVSAETISNYCHLEHFNFTPSPSLSHCECRKLKLWMVNYRIKAGSPFTCGKHDDTQNCDLKFTSKEEEQRRKCFGKGMSLNTTSRWYIILPLVLLILLSLLIPSYLYASKYRAVKHKLHHPKESKSSSDGSDGATNEEVLEEDSQQSTNESE